MPGSQHPLGRWLEVSAKAHLHYITGYIRNFPKVNAPSQFENSYQKDQKKLLQVNEIEDWMISVMGMTFLMGRHL